MSMKHKVRNAKGLGYEADGLDPMRKAQSAECEGTRLRSRRARPDEKSVEGNLQKGG